MAFLKRSKALSPRTALRALQRLVREAGGPGDAATLLGVDASTMSRWLAGKQRIERPAAIAHWLLAAEIVDLSSILDGAPAAQYDEGEI